METPSPAEDSLVLDGRGADDSDFKNKRLKFPSSISTPSVIYRPSPRGDSKLTVTRPMLSDWGVVLKSELPRLFGLLGAHVLDINLVRKRRGIREGCQRRKSEIGKELEVLAHLAGFETEFNLHLAGLSTDPHQHDVVVSQVVLTEV
ncbi:hypothetical protein INR49_028944 [Caranx melampygus]|nr:hypothetical protein INR49_028944 [Caranx melampygus]